MAGEGTGTLKMALWGAVLLSIGAFFYSVEGLPGGGVLAPAGEEEADDLEAKAAAAVSPDPTLHGRWEAKGVRTLASTIWSDPPEDLSRAVGSAGARFSFDLTRDGAARVTVSLPGLDGQPLPQVIEGTLRQTRAATYIDLGDRGRWTIQATEDGLSRRVTAFNCRADALAQTYSFSLTFTRSAPGE